MGHSPEFKDFAGEWRFTRLIEDRRNKVEGNAEGNVQFRLREDDGMDYLENSILSYGSHAPMASERRYIWREGDAGIEVLFDDERFFHLIEENKLVCLADHKCEADMYHVSYDFRLWPQWEMTWRVSGPKKDYRLTTEFRR